MQGMPRVFFSLPSSTLLQFIIHIISFLHCTSTTPRNESSLLRTQEHKERHYLLRPGDTQTNIKKTNMGYPPEKNEQDSHPYMNGSSKEKQNDPLYDDQVSSSSRPSSIGYSGGSKANSHYRASHNGSPSSSTSAPSTSTHPPPLPSRQPSVMTTRQNTFREGSRPPLPPKDTYDQVCRDLTSIYKKKIRPLETTYNFEGFHSAPLTDSDISAKPMVLLLGQYSTVSIHI